MAPGGGPGGPGGPVRPPSRSGGLLIAHIAVAPVHLIATMTFFSTLASGGSSDRASMAIAYLAVMTVLTAPLALAIDNRLRKARPEWSGGQRVASAVYLASAIAVVVTGVLAALLALLAMGLLLGACFCKR